jgi:ATP-dependent Clp protease ATP-binding subunit ClpA
VLSNELSTCLCNAFLQAREAHHKYLTVEHLLLAILGAPSVCQVLNACGADLMQLEQELQHHLHGVLP